MSVACFSHSTAMFLKTLAHKTGGRFHQVPTPADTAVASGLLSTGFSAGPVSATRLPLVLFKSKLIDDDFHFSKHVTTVSCDNYYYDVIDEKSTD